MHLLMLDIISCLFKDSDLFDEKNYDDIKFKFQDYYELYDCKK